MIGEGIVVAGAVRTSIGKFAGAFKDTPTSDLGANAIRAAVERAGISPDVVDEVILGCVGQVGEDAFNARLATLKAGLPEKTTAFNVNRLCGSGLQAINSAVQELRTGEAEVVVAGGNENMSIQPYLLPRAEVGWRLGQAALIDGTLSLVTDPFGRYQMGFTAEKVADRYGVSREAQDKFAAESQQRAAAAIAEGRFKDQIVPVAVPQKKGDPVIANLDEHPRPATTMESLGRLKPAFREGGTVTAGNSSGINDAGAAVVLMTKAKADALGVRPQLEWVADAVAGVTPEIMGIAPIFAVQKLLKKVGMTINYIDLMELNEAFAAQAVAVIRELEIDPEKVNPNGGAIALGHPVGATGAILTVKLAYELKRRQAEWGIVTMCIGGGQGIATLFRNLN
ncbi:MAG: thiolase family protein [Chloroflexota bacterium]|nr:MAG: thiolase family protein [Chloroflexota bacterium]